MRKLTYAITLCAFLLAGCSQDEGIVENKGELVTLNYNVSLGDGVQSRTGETPQLVANKLIYAVYKNGNTDELYRNVVEVDENGKASFSPSLLNDTDYQIVFWAYYEGDNGETCYELDDLTRITVNENYDKDAFTNNNHKDAFTAVDKVNLSESEGKTKSVTLTRPFAQVNLLLAEADFEKAQTLGGTPTTCELTITGHNDVYNALTTEWSQSKNNTSITLNSVVSKNPSEGYYCLANEYLFSSGKTATCEIVVKDAEGKAICTYPVNDMPLTSNASTNMSSQNMLTGGGVTYTITIDQNFLETTNNGTY